METISFKTETTLRIAPKGSDLVNDKVTYPAGEKVVVSQIEPDRWNHVNITFADGTYAPSVFSEAFTIHNTKHAATVRKAIIAALDSEHGVVESTFNALHSLEDEFAPGSCADIWLAVVQSSDRCFFFLPEDHGLKL